MIDFTVCEIEKAFKGLYSDNEVISVTPIIKGYNEQFDFNPKTVYYGRFQYPQINTQLFYNTFKLLNKGHDILFNNGKDVKYDTFSGYRINLKNSLENQPLPVPKLTLYVDDSQANGFEHDIYLATIKLETGANIVPVETLLQNPVIAQGFGYFITKTSQYDNTTELQFTEADIVTDIRNNTQSATLFVHGFS